MIIGLPPHDFRSLQSLPTLVVLLSLSCLRYLAFFELTLFLYSQEFTPGDIFDIHSVFPKF